MGSVTAMGFAELVQDKEVSLDAALLYHLTVNHYPPIPASAVGPARRAIIKAEKGQWDAKVSLRGTEISHRVYGLLVPVRVIIEGWHLDAFIEPDEPEDEGWEGQDHESYTDDQDHESYTVDPDLEDGDE